MGVPSLMPFVKLDCGILDSSIWVEPSDTRVCWITMLAMADANGFVAATAPGIARKACVSLEAARAALLTFESADVDSRSLEADGKRVERVDGGYQILNYAKYREKDHGAAERMRRYRANLALRNASNVTSTVTQAEAEAEAERSKTKASAFALPDWMPADLWKDFEEHRRKLRKPMTDRARRGILRDIERLMHDGGYTAEELVDNAIKRCWVGVFAPAGSKLDTKNRLSEGELLEIINRKN